MAGSYGPIPLLHCSALSCSQEHGLELGPEAQGYSYYFALVTGPSQTLLGYRPRPIHKPVPELKPLKPVSTIAYRHRLTSKTLFPILIS